MAHLLVGLFIVLVHLFLGNLLSYFIFQGFLPGSVLGMILLFMSLKVKIVDANYVKDFCRITARYIPLFFVPIGVGLMDSFGMVKENFLVIIFSSLISTVILLLFIPKFYLWLARRY